MPEDLYMLPFDHRASFSRDLLHIEGNLTQSDFLKIIDLKNIIFEGFKISLSLLSAEGYKPSEFGILVDDLYGEHILREAIRMGVQTATPVERSGLAVFDFEHGDTYGAALKKVNPTYAKVLVRYNPENIEDNEVQLRRLAQLDSWCFQNNQKFLFELLVPPTEKDIQKCGSKEVYDTTLRTDLTAEAIKQIRTVIKHVAVWKLEGFDFASWKKVVEATNNDSKIIVLGRNASYEQVKSWLEDASKYPRIFGFAVGRTVFHKPLQSFVAGELTREGASQKIADEFIKYVRIWHDARTSKK